jgi:hypothetical protein
VRTTMKQRSRRRLLRLGVAAVTALLALVWTGNALATHAPPGTKLWGYEAGFTSRILQYDIGTNTFDTSCIPPGSQNGRGIAFDPRSGSFLWYTFVNAAFLGDGFIHKTSLPPACANLGQIPFGDGPGGLVPDDIGAMDLDPDNGNLYVAEYLSGFGGKDPVSTLFEVNEATGAIIRACNLPTANGFGNDTLAVVKNYPGLPPGKHLVTDNGEFSTTTQFVIPVTSMGAYTPPAGAPPCQIVATGNTPGGRTGIDFEEAPADDMIATNLAQIFDHNGYPWSTTTAVMSALPSSTLEDITLRAQVGPGAPFMLDLQPFEDTNDVGTQHCVTATVTDQSGQPVPGITVVFDVEGASEIDQNPPDEDGTATTNNQGVATFCYTGPDLPGKDVIRAFADTDNDGMQDAPPPVGDEPFDVADKLWVLPPTTPGCEINISNGGSITTATGSRGTFGGNAKAELDGTTKGEEEYQDHRVLLPINFHSLEIMAIVCRGDDEADIFGTGEVNGVGPQDFRIRVKDGGEPGRGVDTYHILVGSYTSGAENNPLTGGNVQIHRFS